MKVFLCLIAFTLAEDYVYRLEGRELWGDNNVVQIFDEPYYHTEDGNVNEPYGIYNPDQNSINPGDAIPPPPTVRAPPDAADFWPHHSEMFPMHAMELTHNQHPNQAKPRPVDMGHPKAHPQAQPQQEGPEPHFSPPVYDDPLDKIQNPTGLPPNTNVDHHGIEMPQIDFEIYEPIFEFNDLYIPTYNSWEVPSQRPVQPKPLINLKPIRPHPTVVANPRPRGMY